MGAGRKTRELAERASAVSRPFVQRYPLNYLLEDGRKHDMLLERLQGIENRMYPCA